MNMMGWGGIRCMIHSGDGDGMVESLHAGLSYTGRECYPASNARRYCYGFKTALRKENGVRMAHITSTVPWIGFAHKIHILHCATCLLRKTEAISRWTPFPAFLSKCQRDIGNIPAIFTYLMSGESSWVTS